MRLLVLGGVAFLIGAWFGFFEARAAADVKYTGFLTGKTVPQVTAEYLSGYAAGNYDTLETVVWFANSQPKVFTAEFYNKQYACLQKIPTTRDTLAWAKDYWNKEPDTWIAQLITYHACEYNGPMRSNTVTYTGGSTHSPAGKNIANSK